MKFMHLKNQNQKSAELGSNWNLFEILVADRKKDGISLIKLCVLSSP